MENNPNHIVAVGTQVVTHIGIKGTNDDVLFASGVVGVITKAPVDSTHAYRVRFMDGTEIALHRRDFTVRKHYQNPLEPGSRAYGLDGKDSDTDWRGIYLPPAAIHWSLYGVPDQLENDETQECFWELQKFITLALKANPNILECLYTPLLEYASPIAQELLDMRSIFLSKMVYQTYNGYVLSQFKKLQKDIENHGAIKWKHPMHLIRLLLSGTTTLREGYVPVHVGDYRERLLAIRRAEVPWEEVNEWRLSLHKEFDSAFHDSKLPDRPDYERANAFLVKARRSVVG